MRAISLFLGVMVLGGCAAPGEPRACSKCGEVPPKATLFQRLGLGRPIGAKAKTATIASSAPETDAATVSMGDDSGPTITVGPIVPREDDSPAAGGPK